MANNSKKQIYVLMALIFCAVISILFIDWDGVSELSKEKVDKYFDDGPPYDRVFELSQREKNAPIRGYIYSKFLLGSDESRKYLLGQGVSKKALYAETVKFSPKEISCLFSTEEFAIESNERNIDFCLQSKSGVGLVTQWKHLNGDSLNKLMLAYPDEFFETCLSSGDECVQAMLNDITRLSLLDQRVSDLQKRLKELKESERSSALQRYLDQNDLISVSAKKIRNEFIKGGGWMSFYVDGEGHYFYLSYPFVDLRALPDMTPIEDLPAAMMRANAINIKSPFYDFRYSGYMKKTDGTVDIYPVYSSCDAGCNKAIGAYVNAAVNEFDSSPDASALRKLIDLRVRIEQVVEKESPEDGGDIFIKL